MAFPRVLIPLATTTNQLTPAEPCCGAGVPGRCGEGPDRWVYGERDRPFEEPGAFDPAFVLRRPPVAASRTVEVSEAAVVIAPPVVAASDRVTR